jgi:diaminohydroxyphosphoribosylaminopyrimidine deaminase / 5-amino-6-(5-phosphoribosylamino)uracil reductase
VALGTGADVARLERCLELARLGRRTTSPNPVVGALVERDGVVVGEGWHRRPGERHAEVVALDAAGEQARGATLYVSLEPCCHHGRTPPCTDRILAAGVRRVVVAALDPYPEVDGRGVAVLRAAGVEVELAAGEIERRARQQNAFFRTLVRLGRPHVTLKSALSLDGRSSAASGESQWISSPQSRRLAHAMRADRDAVAVGIGTALRDDPRLTARDVEPAPERQPLRVVFDREARLPATSRLVESAAEAPVVVVCRDGAPGRARLERAGVETLPAPSLGEALAELGRREVSSLLLEGGPTFAAGFLEAGAVDRVAVFVAPLLLGGPNGLLGGWEAAGLAAAPRGAALAASPVGPDVLIECELREA